MSTFKNIFDLLNTFGISTNTQILQELIKNTIVENPQYVLLTDQCGKLKLFPNGHISSFFRGQIKDHGKCLSSIDRNQDKKEYVLNRLKAIELEILFKNTPISPEQSPFYIPFYNRTYEYEVDYCSMAQHYNIATEYLDLTNNILVASFFSTNDYNYESDIFIPVSEGEGVIYFSNDFESFRTNIIGQQPFPRPGKQMAFAIKLHRNEDFSLLPFVQKITFKQSYEYSSILNELFNSGKFLLPNDPIDKWARIIKKSCKFSMVSLQTLHQRYFNELEINELMGNLTNSGIVFENSQHKFSPDDLIIVNKYWEITKKYLCTSSTRRVLYV